MPAADVYCGAVVPCNAFALTKGDQFRSLVERGPFKYGSVQYLKEAQELVKLSTKRTEREKMVSEYWSENPDSEHDPNAGIPSRSLSLREITTCSMTTSKCFLF
jgi:hypothetical protein